MNNIKYVYDALTILIDISKKSQDKNDQARCSPLSWAKEQCTIKVTTARSGGHTESINRLMFEKNMNIIYISINIIGLDEFENNYIQRCKKENPCHGQLLKTSTFNNIKRLEGKIFPFLDAIVVDMSCFMSMNKEKEIYNIGLSLFSSTKNNYYFIFLQ